MKSIQQLINLFLLFAFISPITYATEYYVDKNATGANNGTNWANAWESFSAIDWNDVDPGDVIYISGGIDSTVYYENLNVLDNGTAANPITIRNSYEPGHNGRVIIDGEFSRTGLISTAGYNDPSTYINIKGFEVRNGGTDPAIQVYYGCKNITFDSLLIYENLERGFRIVGNSFEAGPQNITIKNCSIITPLDVPYQTDGIYTDYTTNMRIDNSLIWARNLSEVNNHSDGLQAYRTRGWKITNSVFVCDSNAQGMAIILGAQSETATSDSVILYNNIIINRGIWWAGNPPDVATFNTRWYSQENMPPTFLYHNTIISYGPDAEGIRIYYPITEARNNIFAQYGSGSNPGGDGYKYTLGSSYNQDVSAFSGENLYFREWSSTVGISGSSNWNPYVNGWDSFVSGGAGGFIADPQFTHNWYGISPEDYTGEIQATSPAINAGDDLQSIIESMGLQWVDRLGNPRDSSPALGAYEYNPGGGGNNPPYAASNPFPANGATNQQLNLTISWTCTDPDGDPLTFDVYFGTNNNPPLASSDQSSTSYNPGQLVNSTTYYWKIVAKDNQGHSTSGPVWNFSTQTGVVNNPPNQPSNPNPSNSATNQQLNLTLSWTCTDPDGDPLTYDVYFGTNSNPPIISTNLSSTIFNPGQLVNSTNYYWKIVAKDNQGHSTSGPVWNFTTETVIVNNPPYPPSNPNPGNGATNQPTDLTLTWNCTDPDGDPITYDVYFGNDDEPPLISTNQSSKSFNPGTLNGNTTYYWRIVAKDNQGHSTSGLVWNLSTLYIDQTPPEIVNAEPTDSVTLHIWFSEPLEQTSAQNINNYSINNSIQIVSVSHSESEVELKTTEHSLGVYTLTVINVKDLADNQIMPPNNTADYEYILNSNGSTVNMKIFLDGPYTDNGMTTDLSDNEIIPLEQPYFVSPWNYYGNEEINSVPENTVDWILIELRTNPSASSMVGRRAAFLRNDGRIIDLTGENQIIFPGIQNGDYYVVVYHRNHLAIMTKNTITLSDSSSMYDFTNSQEKAYGDQAMKLLSNGIYGLFAADGNANGGVNGSDNGSVWRPENGSLGYKNGDFDLNGGVNIRDKNAKWKVNNGKISYVPAN